MIGSILLGKIVRAVLGSMIGRIVLASMLGLAAIKGYGLYERNRGADQALAKIDKQAQKLTKDAVEAREAASVPGSAQRLKKSSCRDC